MGLTTLKYLSNVQLGSGNAIYELVDATPSNEVDVLTGTSAGYPEPLFYGVKGQKPRVRFNTPQLATLLAEVNSGGGAPYVKDESASNTDLWYADSTNLGGRTAAASLLHQRFRMTKGCLYWSRISARHQEDATIDAEIMPIYDGTNPPLQAAGTLALVGTPIGNERFTLGPLKIGSTLLGGLIEATLSSGVKANEEGSDGDIYLTWTGLDTAAPVLEVTARTIEWMNTYGPVSTGATVTQFFIKKSSTGNVANGTANHISVSGTTAL
ncbi:MAG TPA: hypothetical protein VGX78_16935, partial [Pirellulales bacterium]|nr:hypothetical protein [Pirellulales bacterium]